MLEAFIIFFVFFLPFQFALRPGDGIDLAFARVLAIGIFLWWSSSNLLKKRLILPRPSAFFFFTAFVFWSAISFFWAENIIWTWRKTLFLVSFFPLFLVFFDTLRNSCSLRRIFKALVNGAVLSAILALLQFSLQWIFGVEKAFAFWTREILPIFLGPAFGEMVVNYPSLLVDISGRTIMRASGFFPDPHIAALFFGMVLPLAFFLSLENTGARRKYWGVCAAIIFVADIFTFSRGGYLGLVLGASIFFLLIFFRGAILKKHVIKIGIGALILIAILISPVGTRFFSSFASDEGSKIERVRLWREAGGLIALRPAGGVGLGNYSLIVKPSAGYREPFYAHNLFLDIALETGLVGLFFFAGFLFLGIVFAWKKWKQNGDFLALSLLSSLIVFSTHSFFETPIFSVHILPIFVLLMAASVSLENKGEINSF